MGLRGRFYWSDAELIVHSEFRDANVPAGHQQLRVLIEALGRLPAGVDKVWAEEVEPLLRGDVEGALKATTIWGGSKSDTPVGSVCRSCGRFSVVFEIGVRSVGRIGRCTSSRLIPLVASRSWTSPTAANWGSRSEASRSAICTAPPLRYLFGTSTSGFSLR